MNKSLMSYPSNFDVFIFLFLLNFILDYSVLLRSPLKIGGELSALFKAK